jgi:hypothetical protein
MNKFADQYRRAYLSGKTVRRKDLLNSESSKEHRYLSQTFWRSSVHEPSQSEYDEKSIGFCLDSYWVLRNPNWWVAQWVKKDRRKDKALCRKAVTYVEVADIGDLPFANGDKVQFGYFW